MNKSNSVGLTLGIAFAALIAIMIGVGLEGLNRMARIEGETEKLEKRWALVQASSEAMRYSSANNRITMQVFLARDTNEINTLRREQSRNSARVSLLLERIENKLQTPEERSLLADIIAKRQPYRDSYERTLALLIIENRFEAARMTLIEETLPCLEAYRNAWQNFVNYLGAEESKATPRVKAGFSTARKLFTSLLVLASVMAVAIAYFVTRRMAKEIARSQQVESALREASEKLEQRVEERTFDLVNANRDLQDEISQRKLAQTALAGEQRKFQSIFETSPEGIFQTTADGRILCINPALAEIFGYASPKEMSEMVANVGSQLYVDPAQRGEFRRRMDTEGVVRNFEFEANCKGGDRKWLAITACVVKDTDGSLMYYQGFMVDITSQKSSQRERNLMEIQLRHSQKLESVGQLAAGIAHEINTPIQYIGDNLRFVEESFTGVNRLIADYEKLAAAFRENSPTQELHAAAEATSQEVDFGYLREEIPKALQQSLDGVKRVANIVRAMKEFSHPASKEKVLVDINHAIETTVTVARNEWKYVADVSTEFAAGLPMVPCLPDEFNQVILNLVVNAAHAIGDVVKKNKAGKGLIKIVTKQDGLWIEIRISDTGTGIPESIRHRIFEPFFTTKEVGKGTGQGLAIAHSAIVNKHGGQLTFDSTVDQGTTFIIRLPTSLGAKS